jgi:catalase
VVPEPDQLSVDLVDAINDVNGRHAGKRAVHAKGILCAASFTPTAAGGELCAAAHFAGPAVRAHVRFSNGAGKPDAHDGGPDGRGLAVKLYLPGGSTTDIVALTLPVFFVRTPEEFLEFTRARRPDPATGAPDMAVLGAWLAEHPEAQPALQAALGAQPPESYARLTYHGIHAFRWTAPDGAERFVRYRWDPEAGEAGLDAETAMAREPGYLQAELRERLASGPVAFSLHVSVAADGDAVDDPTVAWPEDRESFEAGRLEIGAEAFDRDRGEDVLVFDPTRVSDGIALSGDRILSARSGAYSVSVERRIASRAPA